MKKILITTALLLAFPFIFLSHAQGPPKPPGSGSGAGSGGGSIPVGQSGPVGAPIDGGLSILLVLGAAYGGKKVYDNLQKVK